MLRLFLALLCASIAARGPLTRALRARPLPGGERRSGGGAGPGERRATIFYTGAVQGTLEPCGCTSDPLGDVARMTALVRRAQAEGGAVLLVDAGNLSYPAGTIPVRRQEAADLRAAFLARELARLPFGGSALGETDVAAGPRRIAPPRLAANLAAAPFLAPSRVIEVGGIAVGLFGVTDPALGRSLGVRAEDPVAAAKREAADLRRRGAELIVALVPLERPQARQVARGADVDLVVVGKGVEHGMTEAERVGNAYLVAPAEELQMLGRLDVVLRPGGGRLVDAGGAEAQARRRTQIDQQLPELEAQLAAWRKDRTADPAFLAQKTKERDDLASERARLGEAWHPPATGSYLTNQLIPLRRALPRDPALAAAMRSLDTAIGKANLRHAEPPPAAGPGRAAFVGAAACARCHERETAFWRRTVHAQAWKILVDVGKTGDDECVSCHVTGYGEVGGSSFGFTRKLEAVQCETCHGPGSLHVAQEGLEDPPAVRLETSANVCKRCHTEKHSDTFQFEAYLRDVVGPGHGAKERDRLGNGPTGHQLRSAALARAKAAGQAEAKAM